MRYYLQVPANCPICPGRDKNEDGEQMISGEIEAGSQQEAMDKFIKERNLCPKCLLAGTKSALSFKDYIKVEQLSGF